MAHDGCHLWKPDPACSVLVDMECEVHRQRMQFPDSKKLLSKAIPSTDPQTEIYTVCSTKWNWVTPGNKPYEVVLPSPHSKGKNIHQECPVCFHSQQLPISKPCFGPHILKISTKITAVATTKGAKSLSRNEAC